jgi:hypothetical protein
MTSVLFVTCNGINVIMKLARVEQISSELVSLAGRCRSDLGVNCEVYSAGKSEEDRDLWVLKVSDSP